MGLATYQGVEVDFREKTIGNGNSRGITVKCGSRKQDYKFEPNPHLDPWYNKNHGKFYEEAATALAKIFHDSNANAAQRLFPRYGKKIKVHNVEYTLSSPQ